MSCGKKNNQSLKNKKGRSVFTRENVPDFLYLLYPYSRPCIICTSTIHGGRARDRKHNRSYGGLSRRINPRLFWSGGVYMFDRSTAAIYVRISVDYRIFFSLLFIHTHFISKNIKFTYNKQQPIKNSETIFTICMLLNIIFN